MFPFSGSRLFRSIATPCRQRMVVALACVLAAGLVWGSFEIERMRQLALQRYGAVAVEAVDGWRSALGGWRDLPEEEQLRRVNEFFNRRIRFADDVVVWAQPDYWATPLETLGRGAGDCEDFVFAKYFTLRELGVAEGRLRMTYVRARIGGPASSVTQAHMVLSYYPTPEAVPLVLDNLITEIRPASSRPDLAPVFSFNMQGVFVGGAVQASTPVDRVSRWRELILRMRSEGYTP
jgi:predicted transglutaminase-like cysteine proteinase